MISNSRIKHYLSQPDYPFKIKKLSKVLSLFQTTIQLSKRAIARANENFDIDQIKLLFINYHYGKDLAERVKKYIDKGHNEKF